MTPVDDDGWIDMDRYPNIDPDQALEATELAGLRDALHADAVPRLADDAWQALLAASASAEPPADPEPADVPVADLGLTAESSHAAPEPTWDAGPHLNGWSAGTHFDHHDGHHGDGHHPYDA